ncbi:MAG TPA: hypothetical protein VKS99_18255, partial [Blastocatellia bacterium]|nr:hypothetical protein [Blastocatellia bacterium]
ATMDAKIHTGFLFITRCLLYLVEDGSDLFNGEAMPEAALAQNSCYLAKTASKSRKTPGEQNCSTCFLEKISPKA